MPAQLKLTQVDQSIECTKNGQLITAFRTDRHVPCLYPLIGPNGSSVTRHFPFRDDLPEEQQDHPHHISFWFTHGLINGHDFWHVQEGHTPQNNPSKIVLKSFADIAESSFTAKLSWEHRGEVLLTEIRQYAFELTDQEMIIDLTSTLTAITDITFGDTKEGSAAIRLTPTLRSSGRVAKGTYLNSEGQMDEDAWGRRAQWVAYHGPDSKGEPTVVALMDHPDNLRHPTWWHARPYGLLGANPFGRHDFEGRKDEPKLGEYTLAKGKTITQKYRLVIQHGAFNAESLKTNYLTFSKQ